ncbi:hypothetical protein Q31a_53600 [Aureliella helgolandensis]|uniref:Uncharacterized protein n=1 Tax=Aureliella helgolandensis TaxID=2527968 RepID=A0A518GEJ2_9BACT|nr:hypothetical protein Q31a_53600 [Aureliella helgolandensis]
MAAAQPPHINRNPLRKQGRVLTATTRLRVRPWQQPSNRTSIVTRCVSKDECSPLQRAPSATMAAAQQPHFNRNPLRKQGRELTATTRSECNHGSSLATALQS